MKQARCKALSNGHKACLVLTASFKALLTKCPGGKCQFSRAGPCPALWTARTSAARRYLLQKGVSEESSLPTLTLPWGIFPDEHYIPALLAGKLHLKSKAESLILEAVALGQLKMKIQT